MGLPLAGSLALSLLPSVVNTVGNAVTNNNNRAAQIRMQQQMNNWSAQQALNERLWNSPAHQVQLLKAAGINPNFSDLSFIPTSSPSAPSSPNMNQQSPMALDSLDPSKQNQNIRDAAYNDELSETERQLRSGRYVSQWVQVEGLRQSIAESKANVARIAEDIVQIKENVKKLIQERTESASRTSLNYQQYKLNDKYLGSFDKRLQAELNEMFSRSAANYATAENQRQQAISQGSLRKMYDENAKVFTQQWKGLLLGNKFNARTFNYRVGSARNAMISATLQNDILRFSIGREASRWDVERYFQWYNAGMNLLNNSNTLLNQNPFFMTPHETQTTTFKALGGFNPVFGN